MFNAIPNGITNRRIDEITTAIQSRNSEIRNNIRKMLTRSRNREIVHASEQLRSAYRCYETLERTNAEAFHRKAVNNGELNTCDTCGGAHRDTGKYSDCIAFWREQARYYQAIAEGNDRCHACQNYAENCTCHDAHHPSAH